MDLLREPGPEWRVLKPGEPEAGPLPLNGLLFKNDTKGLTVMVTWERLWLHMSVSTHSGQPCSNEQCQFVGDQLFSQDIEFREIIAPQFAKDAARRKLEQHIGEPLPASQPVVRHFIGLQYEAPG